MAPPAPAPPAILAYLTLANKLSVSWDAIHYMKPPSATPPSLAPGATSDEWEAEWNRGIHLANTSKPLGTAFSGAFIPGSLEGVWEGLFTVRGNADPIPSPRPALTPFLYLQYTEFTAYSALLSGAPPPVLQRSLVAHHPHLWKLREHHLYAPVAEDTGDVEVRTDRCQDVWPVAPGNPLRGHIPNGTQVGESSEGVLVKEPGRAEPVLYRSWASVKDDPEPRGKLLDVFITGEVRSAPILLDRTHAHVVRVAGSLGVGSVQPYWPYQAVRRVH